MGEPHLCEDEAGKSFFAEPVAVFLADQQDRLANFLQMLGHCLLDGIGVVFFQRGKNIEVLTEQHFRRRDVIEAHVTYAVDSGLDIFDGVPCQLAVRNGCQFLVKIVIQFEEIIQLFAFNGNPLLIEILLKLIALTVGDLGCGPARHRTFDSLTNKAAVSYLREGDLVNVAAALRTDLDQSVFRELNKRFAHRLTRDIETNRHLFFGQRRTWRNEAVHNVTAKNAINLLIYGLCRVELRFDGHLLLLFKKLTYKFYHFFVASYTRPVGRGAKLAAMNAQSGKRLGHGHHFYRIDVHMGRQGGNPPDRFGHILRR
ncbi:hypothetical protein Cf24236_2281 [Citrobacter farmeri]|nr:hypothetical protein Cf24236_2281 [Citrobacter farmeri]